MGKAKHDLNWMEEDQTPIHVKGFAKIGWWVCSGGIILAGAFYFGVVDRSDITDTLRDANQVIAVNQFLRYCKPNLALRIVNGYDDGTCREKLAKLSDIMHNATPTATNYDIQQAVHSNAEAFQERRTQEKRPDVLGRVFKMVGLN